MAKTLLYSCVFFNKKYINLINLLLKSYKLFGNSSDEIDYLIICNPDFQAHVGVIFDNFNLNGKIWCLDFKNIFEACYSRLKIFDYPDIHLYDKILYLDCDILITNSINKVLDFQLENKLYALKDGNIRSTNHGGDFFLQDAWQGLLCSRCASCFPPRRCARCPGGAFSWRRNCSAFTSAILLFNNNTIIKELFLQILLHISNHIFLCSCRRCTSSTPRRPCPKTIPPCFDQPFIVYHAVKNNLYDNEKLINLVVNNPVKFNGETISHFPGGPGHYESKIFKMSNFMNRVLFNVNKNNQIILNDVPGPSNQIVKNTSEGIICRINLVSNHLTNKKYKWGNSTITFLENGKMNAFGSGKYSFINKYLVRCDFGGREYLLKFNQDYSTFISIRRGGDFKIVVGHAVTPFMPI